MTNPSFHRGYVAFTVNRLNARFLTGLRTLTGFRIASATAFDDGTEVRDEEDCRTGGTLFQGVVGAFSSHVVTCDRGGQRSVSNITSSGRETRGRHVPA